MEKKLQLEIKEINDVRMLLDGIYCLINNIAQYPQYNFESIKRLAEIAQEIESQTNKKLSSVERALHPSGNIAKSSEIEPAYKGFGDKP